MITAMPTVAPVDRANSGVFLLLEHRVGESAQR